MFHALDHVIVAVHDLEVATRTYTALLGREPSWRGGHPELGTQNALFRLDNTYLELLSPAEPKDAAVGLIRDRLTDLGEGVLGFALGCDDAEETAKSLRERGLVATGPIAGSGRDLAQTQERVWRSVFLPFSESRGPLVFAIEHLSPADSLPKIAPTGAIGGEVFALDHIVVNSRDAESTREFYGDKLGLRLALDRSFPARGLRLIFFRVGGVTVEIASRLDAPVEPAARDVLWGLAWRVRDADRARERLLASGARVSPVRDGHKPGTRVCTVESETHGVATLLIEPGESR